MRNTVIKADMSAAGRFFEDWSKKEYTGIKPGLGRIRSFFSVAGIDPSSLKIIHVAGTNGKGSVAAYLSAILRAAGLKVGLYTSPHLIRVEERINFDGRAITRKKLYGLYARYRRAAESSGLTFFETMTALAAIYFSQCLADVAVMEVGVGGTYDATNVFDDKAATVITGVSRDHEDLFGKDLADVIAEDLGIVRKGIGLVVGDLSAGLFRLASSAARRTGCGIYKFGADFKAMNCRADWRRRRQIFDYKEKALRINGLEIALMGGYQAQNAAAAVKAAIVASRVFGSIVEVSIRKGLSAARWTGRFDIRNFRGKTVIVDGAHNDDAMRRFVSEYLKSPLAKRRTIFVFGALRDKDYSAMARSVVRAADEIAVPQLSVPRALPAVALVNVLKKITSVPVRTLPSGGLKKLLSQKTSARLNIIVAGSLYLAGEALGIIGGKRREQ
ncbi:MAG: Mur ligase family protein [Endomicrobiia bacterium]|nr:Mur ligase family protein [Endomicrobiia bacterium]